MQLIKLLALECRNYHNVVAMDNVRQISDSFTASKRHSFVNPSSFMLPEMSPITRSGILSRLGLIRVGDQLVGLFNVALNKSGSVHICVIFEGSL